MAKSWTVFNLAKGDLILKDSKADKIITLKSGEFAQTFDEAMVKTAEKFGTVEVLEGAVSSLKRESENIKELKKELEKANKKIVELKEELELYKESLSKTEG